MNTELDDLSAVRIVYDALVQFDAPTRERILRWVDEKLNSGAGASKRSGATQNKGDEGSKARGRAKSADAAKGKSESSSPAISEGLRTFLKEFGPKTANQIIAATASYIKQSPEAEFRKYIEVADVENAYLALDKTPPTYISQLLVTAKNSGYMKSTERGRYSITAVGEEMLLEFQRSKHNQ